MGCPQRPLTTTRYLGHVSIDPPLDQSEDDDLRLFSRSRRRHREHGPYEVVPLDPGEEVPTVHGDEAAERYDRMAEGQLGCWCQWVLCPRGCEELECGEAEAAVVAPLAPARPRAKKRGTSRRP